MRAMALTSSTSIHIIFNLLLYFCGSYPKDRERADSCMKKVSSDLSQLIVLGFLRDKKFIHKR